MFMSNRYFYSTDECFSYINTFFHLSKEQFSILINKNILPVYKNENSIFILADDIDSIMPNLSLFFRKIKNTQNQQMSFIENDYDNFIEYIEKCYPDIYKSNIFGLTCRKILNWENTEKKSMEYVITKIKEHIYAIKTRQKQLSSQPNIFGNSAYYMGSKKRLCEFLVESIIDITTNDTCIFDLMCGSGAASSAFSLFWETVASDAQEFCTILAKVQGGGYDSKKTEETLALIRKNFFENYYELNKKYKQLIEEEERLFHLDYDSKNQKLYDELFKFWASIEIYDSKKNNSTSKLIDTYKKDIKKFPYCLFTSYFTNVFFGLKQSMQIDSLRYAIDKLPEEDKDWALGALIITCSAIGTTHAGHFAQPKKITEKNLTKIIKTKLYSIIQEFYIRFRTLTEENKKNKIDYVKGPWKEAVNYVKKQNSKKDTLVYLDAPYTREEYSRYYHVLETLTKYDYPSSEGRGRLRSKVNAERFRSEFFTNNSTKINETFIEIIGEIIEANWKCAWSYSDNGNANILTVIEQIKEKFDCKITTYSTPHKHISQRKKVGNGYHNKTVTEYLIIFEKKNHDNNH